MCDKKGDCLKDNTDSPCSQKECCWHINSDEYFNCFLVFKHFLHDNNKYSLCKIAEIMGLSHMKVKIIEQEAIKKIKKGLNLTDRQLKELKELNQ